MTSARSSRPKVRDSCEPFELISSKITGGHSSVLALWSHRIGDALQYSGGTRGTGPDDNIDRDHAPARQVEFLRLSGSR